MTWLLSVLGWIVGKLFGKTKGPSQEAVAAKEAGTAQAELASERKSNETVQKAADARADVVRDTATYSGLRAYEARDPNNRDNA